MFNFLEKQFRQPKGLWGQYVSGLMKKGNWHGYEKIIPALSITKDDRILEIGYGHGLGINKICTDFDCTITGIDFSKLMHKEASKRNKKHIDANKAQLHYGDYLEVDFEKNSFDKIFFINVIYFWEKLDAPFKKLWDELKPNGTLCIFMAHKDKLNEIRFIKDEIFSKYTIEYVTAQLEKIGFENIEYQLDNAHYCLKCNKPN